MKDQLVKEVKDILDRNIKMKSTISFGRYSCTGVSYEDAFNAVRDALSPTALTTPVDVQGLERLVEDTITEIDKLKGQCLEAYKSADGTEGDSTAGLNFGLTIARNMLIDIQGKIKGHTAAQQPSVWEKALVSLTPGGSEFAGDPERCVEHIKQGIEYTDGMLKDLLKEKKQSNKK